MTNPSDMWMISWTWEMLSVPVVGPFTLYLYTIIIPADNSITHTSENTNVYDTKLLFSPLSRRARTIHHRALVSGATYQSPGQWWGGEDKRNKSWCPVQPNRLTLWSADDIYDLVNTVYVVLIDFSPCHRSIYMLGFCNIIQKKWLDQLLFISWSFKAYMNQIFYLIQTISDLFFFYTLSYIYNNKKCNPCACDEYLINLEMITGIRKKSFFMLKYSRESLTFHIFFINSEYFCHFNVWITSTFWVNKLL